MSSRFSSWNGEWELTGQELIFHGDPLKKYKLQMDNRPYMFFLGYTIPFILGAYYIANAVNSSNLSISPILLIIGFTAIIALPVGLNFISLYFLKTKRKNRLSYSEINYVKGSSFVPINKGFLYLTVNHGSEEKELKITFRKSRFSSLGGRRLYDTAVEKFEEEGIKVKNKDLEN